MKSGTRWAGMLLLLAYGLFGQAACARGSGPSLLNLVLGVGAAVGGYYLIKALD